MINVLLILALHCFTAKADGVPSWVTKSPAEDIAYKYYVGRGSGISEAEGVSSALENARAEAVRDNFGVVIKVQAQAFESLDSKSFTNRMDEASFSVLIKNFQQVEIFNKDGQYWVLYKYGKEAINAEHKRLASLPKEAAPKFTVVNGKKEKGGVEVVTEPGNAAVNIDGISFATSPVKIVGRLEAGEHTIRLELQGYKTIEEQLIVAPGVTVKIRKIFIPDPEAVEEIEKPPPEQNERDKLEEELKQRFYNTQNPRPDLS